MKYTLPKKILAAKEASADFYVVDGTAHPSVAFPIPTTTFQKDFLNLAEQLKEKVGLAPTPKRVVNPINNTKLDSNGNLVGEVETQEIPEDKPVTIDLAEAAKAVTEGIKRPNFKKLQPHKVTEPPTEPIKDERDSTDKQPTESVACEASWKSINRMEQQLLSSEDREGIRRKIHSKARQSFLLDKIATESGATEGEDKDESSSLITDNENKQVNYYVYKFFEDGSLLNTAFTDIYPASGDYSKTEVPCALVNHNRSSARWEILESKNLTDSHLAELTEAVEVLNEDGNPLSADKPSDESFATEQEVFINNDTDANTAIEEQQDLSRFKLTQEELLTINKQSTKPQQYSILILPENVPLKDDNGNIQIFSTHREASNYAESELDLLQEDYEIVEGSEEDSATETVSNTWYALVATESDKKTISKIVLKGDKPEKESIAKEYLTNHYGENSIYTLRDTPIDY